MNLFGFQNTITTIANISSPPSQQLTATFRPLAAPNKLRFHQETISHAICSTNPGTAPLATFPPELSRQAAKASPLPFANCFSPNAATVPHLW
jgi:hypothetical protein